VHPVQSRNLSPFFRIFAFSPWLVTLLGFCLAVTLHAANDFQTDNPKLVIELDNDVMRNINADSRERVFEAQAWIRNYYQDWQWKFERLHRNIHVTLIPMERQINVYGIPAEGLWTWSEFNNEEGSLALGIVGDIRVNLNSTYISQEALVAHESSHAFLLAYCPKLLETGADFRCYNEGLAELFAIDYEKNPWRRWPELIAAQKRHQPFDETELSSFARRILHVMNRKPQCSHDLGFFYLYVVRNSKVNLEKDLKECNNDFIKSAVNQWLDSNGPSYDLPMIN